MESLSFSVVAWGSDRQQYYYKSGDEEAFDLLYWPLSLPSDFDIEVAILTMKQYEEVWVRGVHEYFLSKQSTMSAALQQLVSDSLCDFMHCERSMMDAIISTTRLQFRRFKDYFEFEVAQQSLPLVLPIPASLSILPLFSEVHSSAASSLKLPCNIIVVDDDDDAQENVSL